jgi:hypothetical protein
VGKSKEKEVDKRTAWEKMQDLSRDIFVSLFILVVLVIPTAYIGVRTFHPMTVPGYENTTFANYMVDQFSYHLGEDVQQVAFLKILVAPYKSGLEVLVKLFSQKNTSFNYTRDQFTWRELPSAWWTAIQKEGIDIIQTIKRLYPKDYKD